MIDQSPPEEETDLVFTTAAGGKITHMGAKLTKLGNKFGKKFTVSVNLRVELVLVLMNTIAHHHNSALTCNKLLQITPTLYISQGNRHQSGQRMQ